MEFYFIGDEELVTAFRFIGIEGMAVKDANEAVEVFKDITEGAEVSGVYEPRCQVLILTEETAEWLGDHMINWQISGRYPLIVEIPGISGRHIDRKTLVDLIREAIGIHV
ncbi:MAG: V-type ATP synthase subunit F [Treponema sp.]|jgi:V/A-type H+-transporting ATPase subunit F|nr:V-type ATP synthase subunit F [Treponema sp.]